MFSTLAKEEALQAFLCRLFHSSVRSFKRAAIFHSPDSADTCSVSRLSAVRSFLQYLKLGALAGSDRLLKRTCSALGSDSGNFEAARLARL